MRNEQSELDEIRNPSFELSQAKSSTASSWPLSSPSFSFVVVLNTFIDESSEATYTKDPDLSKIAQLAEFSPESNWADSLTILMSQIFVMPSQSADTILSP